MSIVRLMLTVSIVEDQFEAFERVAQPLIDSIRRERATLAYEWYLSPDHRQCRIVATYASPQALLAHLRGPGAHTYLPQFADIARITSVEVCGDPVPEVVRLAKELGGTFFATWRGFSR